MNKVYDVGIIGGGAAGIGCGVECLALGIQNIVVFEKGESFLSTLRQFYKDGKRVDKDYKGQQADLKGHIPLQDGNKESTLEFFDKVIQENNLNIHYKTDIESIQHNGDIFTIHTNANQTYQARFVVIAIGKMGQPNKPTYPIPSSIKRRVQFNANNIPNDEKLLVVGGGNSAVEYATLLCQSNDTTLNYRRSEFARINDINATQLKEVMQSGKLKARLGVDIVSLEDEGGKVKVCFSDSQNEVFDRVVDEIGGAAPTDFLHKCNIKLDENNVPICDKNESAVKNLFIAGDILFRNGGSIAIALNHGYDIALEIKKRLDSKEI